MKHLRKSLVLVILVLFAFSPMLGLAADKQYFVLKDKLGRCSVRQMEKKSETTIAGPFSTKAEAQKAKDRECPKAEKKSSVPEKKAPDKK